jgi:hypothetical protein
MKMSVVTLSALLVASAVPQVPAHAQAPPPGQPYIQIPIPGIPGAGPQPRSDQGYDRERCERLGDREQDIRDRLAGAPPYSEEREGLEHRLREVRYERERCWHR